MSYLRCFRGEVSDYKMLLLVKHIISPNSQSFIESRFPKKFHINDRFDTDGLAFLSRLPRSALSHVLSYHFSRESDGIIRLPEDRRAGKRGGELNGAEFVPIPRSAVPCIRVRRPRFVSIFIACEIISRVTRRDDSAGRGTDKWVSRRDRDKRETHMARDNVGGLNCRG